MSEHGLCELNHWVYVVCETLRGVHPITQDCIVYLCYVWTIGYYNLRAAHTGVVHVVNLDCPDLLYTVFEGVTATTTSMVDNHYANRCPLVLPVCWLSGLPLCSAHKGQFFRLAS